MELRDFVVAYNIITKTQISWSANLVIIHVPHAHKVMSVQLVMRQNLGNLTPRPSYVLAWSHLSMI